METTGTHRGAYAAVTGEAPWGDYGSILVHGMTAHLERVDGRLQLERTGPFVPGVTLPGIGDLIVTSAVRAAIEAVRLSGCSFARVDKARIVRLPWSGWDTTTELLPELPDSGEPEDFILALEHDAGLAEQLGELWELVAPDFARVERRRSELGRFHYRFTVYSEGRSAPDFFRASNMRCVFMSDRARSAIGHEALRWCRFHPAEFA